jgi:hypothetical protein
MPGTKSSLTPLESRKQLLLLESELNRVQLLNEARQLKNELGHLQEQVQTISSLAASAANLAATCSAIAKVFSPRAGNGEKKQSWISTLFNGLKTGSALWENFRSRRP